MLIWDCENIQTDSSKGHLHTKKMCLWAVFCKRKSQKQQTNDSEGHLSSANNSQKWLPALGTKILSQSHININDRKEDCAPWNASKRSPGVSEPREVHRTSPSWEAPLRRQGNRVECSWDHGYWNRWCVGSAWFLATVTRDLTQNNLAHQISLHYSTLRLPE